MLFSFKKMVLKSDSAFEWIKQPRPLTPPQMITHLRVVGELIIGSVNGTFHVVRDNLHTITAAKKRTIT